MHPIDQIAPALEVKAPTAPPVKKFSIAEKRDIATKKLDVSKPSSISARSMTTDPLSRESQTTSGSTSRQQLV